ncbi:EKC/KEOPS complex subunit TPRKB isoform X2 [Neoarius graeffei]|uniref:EKC/KEOPS complex subunit TPRKB isoform X2 n=1 Tax=Neoarius graeffei TaxID=443677 RepID=UPI00298BCD64|nr:EKC/KEOPS complex subunit TPRKB isoform X2 [Neoarius graeffei]
MDLTSSLELFPEFVVTQLLFKDVKNCAELRKMAIEGKIAGALINPSMVLDPFQTVLAANKAVHVQKIGKMKTRSLYSEIIFNLSPTNNISEAFKRFGISDNDHAVLIVLVHNKEDANNKDDLLSKVDGQQIPADQISTLSDLAKIKKLYKVAPQEEKCGSILDAVICRMAAKDVI